MRLIKSTNNKIALTHLTSKLKQTLVAVLSVTFGISMYVFMNGFMNGVNDTQTHIAFSTLAHIRVFNDLPEDRTNLLAGHVTADALMNIRNPKVIQYTEGIKNSEKYMDLLTRNPQISVVGPEVNVNVFFRNGSIKINGLLSGVDPEKENKLFQTADYLVEGNWEELQRRSDGIAIGVRLAEKLSVKINDNVVVVTADGVTKNCKVVAIFETSINSVDKSKAYIRISSARQLLSENMSYVTDIQANIKDFNEATKISNELGRIIPYQVESWQQANGQLVAANELRNIIAIAVSLTILLVAGFGIYNIMNMTVNEKIKEIAILKAMGFGGKDVVEIFLTQSIIIGIIGGVVGLGFGYIISVIIDHIPFKISILNDLPITYRSFDYILAFLFGLLTTFIAGYLPAKKASKIDPVEIIRG